MFANTLQMRSVIKMAMKNVGAFAYITHTDLGGQAPGATTRYVGFNVADRKAHLVAAEAKKIAKSLGFTNWIRLGRKSNWMVRTVATIA